MADCLAASPDGQYVAIGDRQALAWVRRLEDGQLVETLRNVGNVHSFCFSADSKQLLSASQQGQVLVTTLGHPERSGYPQDLKLAVAWQLRDRRGDARLNFTGTRFWYNGHRSLVVSELGTGRVLEMFKNCLPGEVQDWEYSPDELSALVTTDKTAKNRYFLLRRHPDSEDGTIVAEFDSELAPRFNENSTRIASYAAGKLSIRDAADGSELRGYPLSDATAAPPEQTRGRLRWFDGGKQILVPLTPHCMRCDLRTGEWFQFGPLGAPPDVAENGILLVESDGLMPRVVVRDGLTGTVALVISATDICSGPFGRWAAVRVYDRYNGSRYRHRDQQRGP